MTFEFFLLFGVHASPVGNMFSGQAEKFENVSKASGLMATMLQVTYSFLFLIKVLNTCLSNFIILS